jgi:hypothetical protein
MLEVPQRVHAPDMVVDSCNYILLARFMPLLHLIDLQRYGHTRTGICHAQQVGKQVSSSVTSRPDTRTVAGRCL